MTKKDIDSGLNHIARSLKDIASGLNHIAFLLCDLGH